VYSLRNSLLPICLSARLSVCLSVSWTNGILVNCSLAREAERYCGGPKPCQEVHVLRNHFSRVGCLGRSVPYDGWHYEHHLEGEVLNKTTQFSGSTNCNNSEHRKRTKKGELRNHQRRKFHVTWRRRRRRKWRLRRRSIRK
jgi:hypothetical protein